MTGCTGWAAPVFHARPLSSVARIARVRGRIREARGPFARPPPSVAPAAGPSPAVHRGGGGRSVVRQQRCTWGERSPALSRLGCAPFLVATQEGAVVASARLGWLCVPFPYPPPPLSPVRPASGRRVAPGPGGPVARGSSRAGVSCPSSPGVERSSKPGRALPNVLGPLPVPRVTGPVSGAPRTARATVARGGRRGRVIMANRKVQRTRLIVRP